MNAIFKTAGLTCTGELADYSSTADSGNTMRRSFCPKCGTPLFSQSSARPHLIVARTGALDDPELTRPQTVIWSASAPSWAFELSNLDRCPAQPPPVQA